MQRKDAKFSRLINDLKRIPTQQMMKDFSDEFKRMSRTAEGHMTYSPELEQPREAPAQQLQEDPAKLPRGEELGQRSLCPGHQMKQSLQEDLEYLLAKKIIIPPKGTKSSNSRSGSSKQTKVSFRIMDPKTLFSQMGMWRIWDQRKGEWIFAPFPRNPVHFGMPEGFYPPEGDPRRDLIGHRIGGTEQAGCDASCSRHPSFAPTPKDKQT